MDKKAVSLMISYVLLVAIVIGISIGVFAWLKYMVDVEPPEDCKEGTSIILTDYECSSNGIELEIKNNGRFNVKGFRLTVGNNTEKEPITYLYHVSSIGIPGFEGLYEFKSLQRGLLPGGKESNIMFTKACRPGSRGCGVGGLVDFEDIRSIRIQPYVFEKGEQVWCQSSIIKQNLENCHII